MFLSTGPHPKRRGARRKYAGKVNFQDLSRFEDLGTREDEPHLHLYTAVVWHKTLKRRLRIVVLLNQKDPAKPRFIVLDVHFVNPLPVMQRPAYRVWVDTRRVRIGEAES